ncbi:MAG: hypothetical protein KGM95_08110 [Betaproteobacteria bacterium]|nr:hypothetical protein [Betaproteobacteria bacterium]
MTKENGGKPNGRNERKDGDAAGEKKNPHRMRLPGFITEEEIGLGDMVKRTTSYFGIKPCGGCERRATALNRWLVFTRRRSG